MANIYFRGKIKFFMKRATKSIKIGVILQIWFLIMKFYEIFKANMYVYFYWSDFS